MTDNKMDELIEKLVKLQADCRVSSNKFRQEAKQAILDYIKESYIHKDIVDKVTGYWDGFEPKPDFVKKIENEATKNIKEV